MIGVESRGFASRTSSIFIPATEGGGGAPIDPCDEAFATPTGLPTVLPFCSLEDIPILLSDFYDLFFVL